jgi:site-specific recombinase XerD
MLKFTSDQARDPERQLVVMQSARYEEATSTPSAIPAIIADAGENAIRGFQDFFDHFVRSKNTRTAYLHAIGRFFVWCHRRKLTRLSDIRPPLVKAYLKVLEESVQKSTVKQHLAAIRMLFDRLVAEQAIEENPTRGVRSPVIEKGKTTVLDIEQVYKFLDSIDTDNVVGLRDRALIGVMIFACARIGAIVTMQVGDYYLNDDRWLIRLNEKGSKQHEVEAPEILKAYLDAYLDAGALRKASKTPLFRTMAGSRGTLTQNAMNRIDAWRMIQRRATTCGLKVRIGCHTFRATGIVTYLEAGGTLDNARAMASHVSPRTTKVYDRNATNDATNRCRCGVGSQPSDPRS